MDDFIDEVVAIADAVAARRRSPKRIMLSFDEWNVWYRTRRKNEGRVKLGWPVAPSILEEIYDMQDALAFGGACISLLNHADRVQSACLAQLVNAIAPIMTETGGPAWRQTIFFPFADMSNLGRGTVLQTHVKSPTYSTTYYDPRGTSDLTFPMPAVPYLKISAVHNHESGHVTLFVLNRHLEESLTMNAEVRGFDGLSVVNAHQLRHDDLKAVNTKDSPEEVKPSSLDGIEVDGSRIRVRLAPASWSVIRLKV
jgi:alpha-N-arabinofuranosidase